MIWCSCTQARAHPQGIPNLFAAVRHLPTHNISSHAMQHVLYVRDCERRNGKQSVDTPCSCPSQQGAPADGPGARCPTAPCRSPRTTATTAARRVATGTSSEHTVVAQQHGVHALKSSLYPEDASVHHCLLTLCRRTAACGNRPFNTVSERAAVESMVSLRSVMVLYLSHAWRNFQGS